jgi:hypothetical protein
LILQIDFFEFHGFKFGLQVLDLLLQTTDILVHRLLLIEFPFEGCVFFLQGLEIRFDLFVRGFVFCCQGLELVFFDFEFFGCVRKVLLRFGEFLRIRDGG